MQSQIAFCRICECGYSKKDHNEEAGKKTFPTNAFGRQTWRTGITNYNPDCGWVGLYDALELQYVLNTAAMLTGGIPKLPHISTFNR